MLLKDIDVRTISAQYGILSSSSWRNGAPFGSWFILAGGWCAICLFAFPSMEDDSPWLFVGLSSLEDGIDLSMVQDLINERTQVKIFNIVDEMDNHKIVVCLDNLKFFVAKKEQFDSVDALLNMVQKKATID
jgi:hypothetical protein